MRSRHSQVTHKLTSRWLTPAGLDLAQGLLAFDHAQRVSAKEAMSSPYFVSEEPQMERPTQ